jgi:hypothetical protein
MRSTRTWYTLPMGQLVLRTTAEIEGREVCAETVVNDRGMGPPAEYIQREQQRQIMRAIEKELFQ